jgi:hypothetical protein
MIDLGLFLTTPCSEIDVPLQAQKLFVWAEPARRFPNFGRIEAL